MNGFRTGDGKAGRGRRLSLALCAPAFLSICMISCDEGIFVDGGSGNMPPEVWLTAAPPEGDMTDYIVDFAWFSDDPDGTVEYYEYVAAAGDPIGFDPADTTGPDAWTRTTASELQLRVRADALDTTILINEYPYGRCEKTHTFFLRAVDDRGAVSETVYRSFTAFTLAPSVTITEPVNTNPASGAQNLPPVVKFGWVGKDPIDSPWNYQDVDSVRYMYHLFYLNILRDLNETPERFEHRWTPWIARHAPEDSGITTFIGDDEDVQLNKTYVFAVQAKDDAGAVTSVFSDRNNVRVFMTRIPTGPVLTLSVAYFGSWTKVGTNNRTLSVTVPPGFPIEVSWEGDATEYGGVVKGYRYGWDVEDLEDPDQWACSVNPYTTCLPSLEFHTGVHNLFVEAVDNLDCKTIVQLDITLLQMVMDRPLLWVDDFMLNEQFTYYALPVESRHDAFWTGICGMAKGFDPDRDVYDTEDYGYVAPDIELLWRYKNIIWTYGGARDEFNAWMKLVRIPVGVAIQTNEKYAYNILHYYVARGGHLWSNGKGDHHGALAASLPWFDIVMPKHLPPAYVNLSAYHDYCVSVLDKVISVNQFAVPVGRVRNEDLDAMDHMVRASDSYTKAHPDLPRRIDLWDEAIQPGSFFDPDVRGFTYVELYDTKYIMDYFGAISQPCFRPMYLHVAIDGLSLVNFQTCAFWATKYDYVIADADGAIPAPSVHFGVPLWYFDRAAVTEVARDIFRTWGISAE